MVEALDPEVKERVLRGIAHLAENPELGISAAAIESGYSDRHFRRLVRHPELAEAFGQAKQRLAALIERATILDLLTNPKSSSPRANWMDRYLGSIGEEPQYTEPPKPTEQAVPAPAIRVEVMHSLMAGLPQAQIAADGRFEHREIPAEILDQDATPELIADSLRAPEAK